MSRKPPEYLPDWRNVKRTVDGLEILPIPQIPFLNRHDWGVKTFSAFFGNKTISPSGRTEDDARAEIDEIIDMIFDKEEVSKFVLRKIFTFFLYYDLNDEVESQLIEPLSQVFRDNNYELRPVMKAFLTSDFFFREEYMGVMIKSPVDFAVGKVRQFQVRTPQ